MALDLLVIMARDFSSSFSSTNLVDDSTQRIKVVIYHVIARSVVDLSVVVARDSSSSSSNSVDDSTGRIIVVIYHVIAQLVVDAISVVVDNSPSSSSTSIFDSASCVSSCTCSGNCILYYYLQ